MLKKSLCFLHGFLGGKEDWQKIIQNLENEFYCHAIDLPGHGNIPFSDNFLETVATTLKTLRPIPEYFVGYSLGGRILLQLKELYPKLLKHLIILSSHPGLATPEEKKARWQTDKTWIEMLKTKSLSEFFDAWYAQTLFQSLKENTPLFNELIERRKKQNPLALADVLTKCSLAHQPLLNIFPNTIFLCGEKDLKFQALYHKLPSFVKVHQIKKCGHALHLENPEACSHIIRGYLHESS